MSFLGQSILIIAEAGVNHNGDTDLAMELVDVAADAGADAVKFQTFDAQALVTATAEKALYQQRTTDRAESQQQMLAKLQLDNETHHRLKRKAEDRGLRFMSTAFDSPSLAFLVDELNLPVLKIPSGEITNGPLLLEYAQADRDIVLSTGLSTISEVKAALSILAFGFMGLDNPCSESFGNAFASTEDQKKLLERVVLLHCTSQYPAPIESANLRAMASMRDVFGLRIGYSDHTPGIVVAIGAAALGARVIEKHFTLDKNLSGPDHRASLEPHELEQMISSVRLVEQAVGDGNKVPHASEMENRPVARKSLVAAKRIERGEVFSTANIAVKRPGSGISPIGYWDILGSTSKKSIDVDEFIE